MDKDERAAKLEQIESNCREQMREVFQKKKPFALRLKFKKPRSLQKNFLIVSGLLISLFIAFRLWYHYG